jgi:multiple sugar transport system permease protein
VDLGLADTLTGIALPGVALPLSVFVMRQYAMSVPDELLEAARIDGAGEWRIFMRIVLPLLQPIIVTLAIFSFLAAWNDFMWPLIVLTGQEHYTLPIGLASLAREHAQDSELMMAGSVVTVLPVLALFLALQRYYLQGLLLGSVKG